MEILQAEGWVVREVSNPTNASRGGIVANIGYVFATRELAEKYLAMPSRFKENERAIYRASVLLEAKESE